MKPTNEEVRRNDEEATNRDGRTVGAGQDRPAESSKVDMDKLHRLKDALFAFIAVAVVLAVSACSSASPTAPQSSAAPTPTTAPAASDDTPELPIELQILQAHEALLIGLYERIVPSVVRIVSSPGSLTAGEGSGFIWDDEGHIITNYHVVMGSDLVRTYFFNGDEYDATVVGSDPDADIAVIKIDAPAEKLTPVELGNSSELQPGRFTIAVGTPFGQDFTMTVGIVSAVGRLIDSGFSQFAIPEVIQTDAAINPGNSGGPTARLAWTRCRHQYADSRRRPAELRRGVRCADRPGEARGPVDYRTRRAPLFLDWHQCSGLGQGLA